MPHDIRIVTEAELRGVLGLDLGTVDMFESAFAALAGDGIVLPPILSMDPPLWNGAVDVKSACLPGCDGVAIRVSPGLFDMTIRGVPSLDGHMMLVSAQTGLVQAVFADNGYLTAIRAAAAGAVAARHLARSEVETAGVIGAGVQARLQIRAAYLARPFKRLLVWGRDPASAAACAADLGGMLDIEVAVTTSVGDVVRESQFVVTTTPSRIPLVRAEWLHPGLHITAIGSDQSGKVEIAPEALDSADLYVCDRVERCAVAGELEAARAAGFLSDSTPPELGAIVTGVHPGRADDHAITICDLTGTGAQDTAIAMHAMALLREVCTTLRA